MQSAIIVFQQVLVMFLLIGCGILCNKKRMVSETSAREFCSLLLNVAFPAVIVQSLLRPLKREYIAGFLLALGIALTMHLLAVAVSRLLVKKRGDEEYRVERFSVVYSNCAFMAFPLLRATVGEDGVFYATAFVVFFVLFQWTHGVLALGGRVVPKKLLVNPSILAVAAGLLLFFLQIRLPSPVLSAVSMLSAINSPLSMVVTGVFLADLPLSALKNVRLLSTAAIRLLLLPLLAVGALWALGVSRWTGAGPVVCASLAIGFSCPVAVSVILQSAQLKREVLYASGQVAVSTLLSLITLPLVAGVALSVF